jgi:hypothetical protein
MYSRKKSHSCITYMPVLEINDWTSHVGGTLALVLPLILSIDFATLAY